MSFGLRVWTSLGSLQFDSADTAGGVCLGFFTVPFGGGSFSFPSYVTEQGFAFATGKSRQAFAYTTDHALGYLRFNFSSLHGGFTYALFAK